MKPIRGEQQKEVAHDPWEAHETQLQETDAVHRVTDDGALASQQVSRRFASGCGCLKPPAGFCGICGATACADCFGHCRCGKPLCPRHSVFVEGPGGKALRLCKDCRESAGRKQMARRIGRLMLSPFVAFED